VSIDAPLADRASVAGRVAYDPHERDDADVRTLKGRTLEVNDRDALIGEVLATSGDELRDWLGWLTRACRTSYHPDILAVTALAALAYGDGALANAAADRALSLDAGHRLASLARFACSAGMSPDIIRAGLAA
jgi:type II secretory pathway component PulL